MTPTTYLLKDGQRLISVVDLDDYDAAARAAVEMATVVKKWIAIHSTSGALRYYSEYERAQAVIDQFKVQ